MSSEAGVGAGAGFRKKITGAASKQDGSKTLVLRISNRGSFYQNLLVQLVAICADVMSHRRYDIVHAWWCTVGGSK